MHIFKNSFSRMFGVCKKKKGTGNLKDRESSSSSVLHSPSNCLEVEEQQQRENLLGSRFDMSFICLHKLDRT